MKLILSLAVCMAMLSSTFASAGILDSSGNVAQPCCTSGTCKNLPPCTSIANTQKNGHGAAPTSIIESIDDGNKATNNVQPHK